MRTIPLFFVLISFALSCSADPTPGKFAFQGIQLDTAFDAVPVQYRSDCGSGSNDKYVFCHFRTNVGEVPMSVDLWFTDKRLSNIQAYFPIEHYDVVALALREKYGPERSRTSGAMAWFAGEIVLGLPTPDMLVLKRQPTHPKSPDGKYIVRGTQYGALEFDSLSDANEITKRLNEQHDRKVKGVAEKL